MIKRFFIAALATAFTICSFAVNVTSESALVSALSAADKNITITSNFTTTKNITIPEGYVVTLSDGVTLTLGYKSEWFGLKKTYYSLSGSGTVVAGAMKIVTKEKRILPTVGGSNNKFAGMEYEVTEVDSSGGKIVKSGSNTISCKINTSVSVDNGVSWTSLDFSPAAVVCNVSSGINGGRTFVAAYSSFNDAYAAAKFTSYPFQSSPVVTNGKVVVLLADGTASPSGDQKTIGLVVDCAGYSGGIGVELKSNSFVTLLNASTATTKQLTNSGVAYLNCSTAKASAVNTNQDTYSGQVHIYDCGSVSLPSKFPSGGGAFFYCGSSYSTSFGTNYKIYGGSYKNDPTSYLASTDLEAVKGSDGNWVVQEKKPVVDVVKVAKIGDTTYETLQAAIDAASDGAKIEFISDVELSTPVTIAAGETVTLELAGFDIAAANGAIINNGSLKLEDSSNYDEPSTLSTTSGNLIENNGTLEVTYGTYSGDVLLNAGEFIVHGGKFDGTLKAGVNVSAATSVANLRGGQFKNSVAAFLANEYIETLADGYYWVGKFPYPIVTEKSISNAEKGWSITGLSDEDRSIYVKTSTSRSDYTDAQWYRRAELNSMLTPFIGYAVDCVVKFNRPVKAGSVRVYAQTQLALNDELDRDMAANEIYRALSTKIAESGYTQLSFSRFLKGDEFPSLAVGLENLSDENDGTTCTIELQLCRTKNNVVTETVYVIASESYQFPIHYVTVALPTIDNATWVYNGETVSGSITVQRGSNVELTLNAAEGYQFADGQTSTTIAINKVSSNIANNNVVFNSIVPPKKSALLGSGTEAAPFLIMSLEDLVLFRDSVNAGETKYNAEGVWVALGADIDMSSVDWSVNIGDDCNATFDGIFDGKNYTISNLTSTETAQKGDGYVCTGLFGAIYGSAQIKNLTLENVNITAEFTGNNVAALVGFAYNCSGAIDNVTVTNVTINAANATGVGAIVGYDYYSPALKVTNCTVDGTSISAASYVGGVIGYASTKIELNNNTVKNLTLNGTASVGGVAGIMLAGGSASGNAVEKVQLSATGAMWANSVGLVAGTITTGSVTVIGTTAIDCAVTDLIGGILVEKPTSPIEKVQVQIGDSYFTTLDAAIKAAKAGDTIKLLSDVGTDAALVINKELTVDLNGKTIAATENDKVGDGVFCVVAGGELTINDSLGTGVINGVGGNNYNIAIGVNGGKVIINGGNFTNVGATDKTDPNAHFDLIYAENGGEVIINGGNFECETPEFTLNSDDTSKGGITVNGGSFVGFDPRNNAPETAGTSFMATGKYTFAEDGKYSVVTPQSYILNGVTSNSAAVDKIDAALAGAVKITKVDGAYVATADYTFEVTEIDILNPEKSSYELKGGKLRPGKSIKVKYYDLATGEASYDKFDSDAVTFKLVIE